MYDAILIPGGGVRNSGMLPVWVELRLEKAIEIAEGEPIIALSAGTTHKPPPYEPNGWPLLDAVAMVRYLERRGYPAELLWIEGASHDTIGNAFFARMLHTEPAGFRKLLIVTSSFHMPRTEAVFRWIFEMDPPSIPYHLSFCSTPDVGMSVEVLEARIQKERSRLVELRDLKAMHTSLRSLHHWLFTEHKSYAIGEAGSKEELRNTLLDSY